MLWFVELTEQKRCRFRQRRSAQKLSEGASGRFGAGGRGNPDESSSYLLPGQARAFGAHVRVTGVRFVVDGQNCVAVGLGTQATGPRCLGTSGEPSYGSCFNRFTHDLKMRPLPENFVKAGLKLAKNPAVLHLVRAPAPAKKIRSQSRRMDYRHPPVLLVPP